MRRAPLLLLLCALALACSPSQEEVDEARIAAREALSRGDRAAALEAIGVLRGHMAETPEDLLALGELLVLAGEAPEVVWLLEDGVRRFPDHPGLRLGLAQVALSVGDSSAALRALEPITPASERHAEALFLRAQATLRMGDLEGALAILDESVERYPERPEARVGRIAALLREKKLDEARGSLEQAREQLHAAGQDELLRQIEIAVRSLEAEQDPAGAIAGLEALVDAEPADTRAWQALLQAQWRTGRLQEGIARLQAAVAEDPDRLQLYPLLAPLLHASGSPAAAEALLATAVERAPSATAYLGLIGYYLDGDRDAEALERFAEARAAFPGNPILEKAWAETLLSFDRLDEAREVVDEYEEAFPDDPIGEYLRARVELASGEVDAAVARLTRTMPSLDQPFSQYWLGRALEMQGDDDAAYRRYGLALARNPRDSSLYGGPIALLQRRGDWRNVAALANQLVRVAPGMYQGWGALVAGLVNLGDGANAVHAARLAVKQFPDEPDAVLQLARALRTAHQTDDALAALDDARAAGADPAVVAAERALTLGIGARIDEGIAVARAAIAEHPDSAELHAALAALLFGTGQPAAGAAAVDRALALAPDDPRPLRVRAQFRAATGDLDGAQDDCERYLAMRPGDPTVHFFLGVVHERAGRPEAAVASYREAARLDDTGFAARNNLALLLADSDLDAALASAQEAYEIAPSSPLVLDTVGSLYLRKGLVDRAISMLEEAHAALPADGRLQLNLARAYAAGDRSDDARRLLGDLSRREDTPEALRSQAAEVLRSLR